MQTPTERLQQLDRRVAAMEVLHAERARSLQELEQETALLLEDVDLLGKTEQTLLHISTKILGQSTKTIDKLVTTGLHVVFEDLNLEFRTTIEKSRGKTAVKFELLENGRSCPLMEAYGGGPLVVIGVLLRAMTTMALGLNRVLFLDESLAHLSEQYVDNASRLLKKLCNELDFTILMVTHQQEFASHADHRYQAESKNGATTFRKL